MSLNQDEEQALNDLRTSFWTPMRELWAKKRALFQLFRKRLEEEKIEEIKQKLSK